MKTTIVNQRKNKDEQCNAMKTTIVNQRKNKDEQCNDGMILLMIEASYFITNAIVWMFSSQ